MILSKRIPSLHLKKLAITVFWGYCFRKILPCYMIWISYIVKLISCNLPESYCLKNLKGCITKWFPQTI